MRSVAVIPARGGSKGVPGKNLRPVGGRALVARAVDAAQAAALVDLVVVSTDDEPIARAADEAGAEVIFRPPELSGDEASSESALLHALTTLEVKGRTEPEVLVFLQCTSPFIRPDDLDRGVVRVLSGDLDCAFSARATYEFLWRSADGGMARAGLVNGLNHDPALRPRRQDRRPDFAETGAFYVMRTEGFRQARHRFFGRVGVVEVDELTTLEVDTPAQLVLAETMAPLVGGQVAAVDVDVVVTDFDGVHTDDLAEVDQHGTESVRVSRADGLGIERLRRAGVPMLIVSKERNPVVAVRAAKLGVEVLQGVDDKLAAVAGWLADREIPAGRAAYLGNDLNDLEAMGLVGWPVAVADAQPPVRRRARLVLGRPGGRGAVRELCDLVVAARERDRPSGRAATPATAAPGPPAAPTAGSAVAQALAAIRRS